MISFLSGRLRSIEQTAIVLEASGIGWHLQVANPSSFSIDQKVELFIHFQWSAENGPSLYGFLKEEECQVFALIISCSGMGPKIALSMIGNLGCFACIKAIAAHDVALLSSVPGIGTKKAESLILQLKDKVSKLLQNGTFSYPDESLQNYKKIHDVLLSLNYSRSEIQGALEHIKNTNEQASASFDEALRKALGFLAKRIS